LSIGATVLAGFLSGAGGNLEAVRALETVAERVASNQSTFRDANEKIEAAAKRVEDAIPMPFLCECCNPDCTEIARLTVQEYEAVRARSTAFFVLPGHETTHVEGVEVAEVTERNERFSLLNKVALAGDVAAALDPRAQNGHR
jgi:hypothetical protein